MWYEDKRIFVAGHRGLVGSALVRALEGAGAKRLLLRTRSQLDLMNAEAVAQFFVEEKPQVVFMAAAKVGGIEANRRAPADFLQENLAIQSNIFGAAARHGIEKLLFLGSSCIYPKHCPQPMRESHLLSGPLEPTNEAYAIAKIAGLVACRSFNIQYGTRFIAAMPTNLYGPHDNFDLESSHVLPAMLRKFHDAKENAHAPVNLWGSGKPRREFLHVDDLAQACLFLMQSYEAQSEDWFVNVGCGVDHTIAELAMLVRDVVGHRGPVQWDASRPDGTPRKLLDVSRLTELGWAASIPIEAGVRRTYEWYLSHHGG